MSVQAWEQIAAQMGEPKALRWVTLPGGGPIAVARFHHRGAALQLDPHPGLHVIFHVQGSRTVQWKGGIAVCRTDHAAGSVLSARRVHTERVDVLQPTETLHLLFPRDALPLQSIGTTQAARTALLCCAVGALVGMTEDDDLLQRSVAAAGQAFASAKGSAGGLQAAPCRCEPWHTS